MKELKKLLNRIIQQVNVNLREQDYDVTPYLKDLVPLNQMVKFYAFYGITPHHLLNFEFMHSSLAGSYFLGNCRVTNSILYKSDIRGDELKKQGDRFPFKGFDLSVSADESIDIRDSFLVKTLVHNYSHDPETLERFQITSTASTHYANIHGSPMNGSFIGPFATVDLTTTEDCIIGTFSYVQAGEISHLNIKPGTVWVRVPGEFNFLYRYPRDLLTKYICYDAHNLPQGLLMDFMDDRKNAFERIFNTVNLEPAIKVPDNASLDRFAVIKPKTQICDNVLVAQRAYLQNSFLGKGANAQENCYLINTHLEGNNVTAHGAKIIEADLGQNVFVGFNSFLRGRPERRLTVGKDSIIMPHTIIDISKPLQIPPGHLVWGLITGAKDLSMNSMKLSDFSKIDSYLEKGGLIFEGKGKSFVDAFHNRIQHILEANGALFDGKNNKGHAQRNQKISFNTIQPYPDGDLEGLYPTILIKQ